MPAAQKANMQATARAAKKRSMRYPVSRRLESEANPSTAKVTAARSAGKPRSVSKGDKWPITPLVATENKTSAAVKDTNAEFRREERTLMWLEGGWATPSCAVRCCGS